MLLFPTKEDKAYNRCMKIQLCKESINKNMGEACIKLHSQHLEAPIAST